MALAQSKTYDVKSFEEVIISPHIEVVFEKADTESVVIENINESYDKLNVEVKGKTLHIYLDDAKVYTKSKKVKTDDYKGQYAIYDGTVVSAKVYYTDLELVSLRGDETHKLTSKLTGDEFKINIYGEPKVYVSDMELDEFSAPLYGEGYLEVEQGRAQRQKIVSYGESEVNTLGVYFGLKYGPRVMNDGGAIINTASLAASYVFPGSGAYSASKAAVANYTTMAAAELAQRKIRVNAVAPSFIRTPLAMDDIALFEKIGERATNALRIAEPEEVAAVFHFLASDDASYITGQVINVDGGMANGLTEAMVDLINQ